MSGTFSKIYENIFREHEIFPVYLQYYYVFESCNPERQKKYIFLIGFHSSGNFSEEIEISPHYLKYLHVFENCVEQRKK